MTSVAIYLAVIPVCHVFGVMLAFFALLGVHMGVIDTVANSVLIKIHGKKVGIQHSENYLSREVGIHFLLTVSTNRLLITNMSLERN